LIDWEGWAFVDFVFDQEVDFLLCMFSTGAEVDNVVIVNEIIAPYGNVLFVYN